MKKLFFALSALLLSLGSFAQEPDVTLDFTTNTWGLPTTNTKAVNTYTDGTYSITLNSSTGNGYKYVNTGYLLIGKTNATLTLPTFTSAVEKIEVVGNSGASGSTKQNIYVGDVAVSTETTGSTSTQTYEIAADYQAAGNQYVFKVTSNHNAQITKVNIYYASNLKPANLSFGKDELEFDIDEGEEAWNELAATVQFTKSTTAPVTFSSSNQEVVTVSDEGVVSFVGEGIATITATSEANDEYAAGKTTLNCNFYVNEVYAKDTVLTSGSKYLIVAQRNDTTAYAYNLDLDKTYGYLNSGIIKGKTDSITVKSTDRASFILLTATGERFSILDNEDRYMTNDATYNTFNVSETASTTPWTIKANEDSTFTMTFGEKTIKWGDGKYTSFGCYAEDASANGVLVYLYKQVNGDELQPAQLSFGVESVEYELKENNEGWDEVKPTFTKATDATVTFTSSDDEVATVDEEGNITPVSDGIVTITATCEETDTYDADSVAITCNIYLLERYAKSTKLENMEQYLIVAKNDDELRVAQCLPSTISQGHLQCGSYDELVDTLTVRSTDGYDFTFVEANGKYGIADFYDRFLYSTDESDDVYTTETELNEWTVTLQEDSTFTLAYGTKTLKWGYGNYIDFCFGAADAQDGTPVYLYKLVGDEEPEDPTGITAVNAEKAATAAIYNLAGQQVGKAYKGIVVKNGKKYIQK